MLDTIARKCEMLPLLYQLSVLRTFDRILCDAPAASQPEHREMVRFVQWVVREFFRLAAQAPCLFLEPLVWTRTHRDADAIARLRTPVLLFDAAGLCLFAVTGTQKALAYGLSPLMAAMLGMVTCIGGGVARDLLVGGELGGLGGGLGGGAGGGGRRDEGRVGMLGGDVVGEEVPPGGIDAVPVVEVLLVDLVHQPLVGPEGGETAAQIRRVRRHGRPFRIHGAPTWRRAFVGSRSYARLLRVT